MLWFCNLRLMMPESSRFDAQLINTARRDIIASRRFEAREALNRNDAAAASALGVAADRLAAELIAWAAENHAE